MFVGCEEEGTDSHDVRNILPETAPADSLLAVEVITQACTVELSAAQARPRVGAPGGAGYNRIILGPGARLRQYPGLLAGLSKRRSGDAY